MHNQKVYQYLLVIFLIAAASLGCQLFTSPIEKVQSVATEVATQVNVNSISTQVGSLATENDAGSITTEIGSLTTQIGDIGSLITELPDFSGTKPTDIPIIEGGEELLASETSVSFTTNKTLQEVIDFYNKEMPANGWTKVEAESKKTEEETTLVFEKGNRKATISITDMFISLMVQISIVIK